MFIDDIGLQIFGVIILVLLIGNLILLLLKKDNNKLKEKSFLC